MCLYVRSSALVCGFPNPMAFCFTIPVHLHLPLHHHLQGRSSNQLRFCSSRASFSHLQPSPLQRSLSLQGESIKIFEACSKLSSSQNASAAVHEGDVPDKKSEKNEFGGGRNKGVESTHFYRKEEPSSVLRPHAFAPRAGRSSGIVVGKSGPMRGSTGCPVCGRRHVLGVLGAMLSLETNKKADASLNNYDPKRVAEAIHPARPGWYEELYAIEMGVGMRSYEAQMAGYKAQLFNNLDEKVRKVLELGVGTGPNIKYYAKRHDISIVGVDPNSHMEKYARAAVSAAGLMDSQFKFLQGVGEALPVADSSVDAVICTLVLCSVKDVAATLGEVQRVLKPGGSFLFLEHVAAPEGSNLRFWQNLLDPIQQLFADGCHLTRNTLRSIDQARFSVVDAKNINVANLALLDPHIIGIART